MFETLAMLLSPGSDDAVTTANFGMPLGVVPHCLSSLAVCWFRFNVENEGVNYGGVR